uniref:Ribonuclease P protein subunit p29 n=1 Tax=Romanomermis culicivorax TaxID=13658 RepID=A0A915KC54_ROMCU
MPVYAQSFILERTIVKEKKEKPNLCNIVRKYHDLNKCKVRYQDFLPVYELWKQYMKTTFGSGSKNESQISLNGIVVRETKNTFQIVTKKDKFITLPKCGSNFQFILDDQLYTIYGDNFCFTPDNRIQKKFKNMLITRLIDV